MKNSEKFKNLKSWKEGNNEKRKKEKKKKRNLKEMAYKKLFEDKTKIPIDDPVSSTPYRATIKQASRTIHTIFTFLRIIIIMIKIYLIISRSLGCPEEIKTVRIINTFILVFYNVIAIFFVIFNFRIPSLTDK